MGSWPTFSGRNSASRRRQCFAPRVGTDLGNRTRLSRFCSRLQRLVRPPSFAKNVGIATFVGSAMTAFSPSWRERCPDNPQGVKNLFATFHRVRKSLHCMEQHWLDEYPSSTPIVAPLSDTVLQDIYPANRFRMRNRLISRTDIPVWSCYLKNHPTDRLAFLLDIFLCRSSADALDWATEQTTQDESYTMAAFCLHNDLSLPARLSMKLPPPWPARLAA